MIETLAFILTGLGLAASIVYYANILNNANKTRELQLRAQEHATETRQAQLFMPLYETYRNKEFRRQVREIQDQEWEGIPDFFEKFGPDNNPDAFSSRAAVASYFDGIGVLLKRDLIDVEMVNDLVGNSVISVWEKIGMILVSLRTSRENPYVYTDFEYLYNRITEYRKLNPIHT